MASSWFSGKSFVWWGTALMNVLVMLILDAAYVYILLTYDNTTVAFAQLVLSGLKVMWCEFAIYYIYAFVLKSFGLISNQRDLTVSDVIVFLNCCL